MKTVLILGGTGQDGSYLCEKYLDKKYKVICIDQWSPTNTYPNIEHIRENPNFELITGDVTEYEFVRNIINNYKPDFIYNMAGVSLVPESFKYPERVFRVNTLGHLNVLEAVKNYSPKSRVYFSASSEMFGKNEKVPQNENTAMIPSSPYGVSKLASFHMTRIYREAYGLFVVSGIFFNHSGIRRGPSFITRKISLGVADIYHGKKMFIELGNLNAKRDIGSSSEYCDAMIKMLEAKTPDDYVVATNETHSIREMVEWAFEEMGEKITWKGKGVKEVGINQDGIVRIKINPKFYRVSEVNILYGDNSKLQKKLKWKPKTKLRELIKEMVKNDIVNEND